MAPRERDSDRDHNEQFEDGLNPRVIEALRREIREEMRAFHLGEEGTSRGYDGRRLGRNDDFHREKYSRHEHDGYRSYFREKDCPPLDARSLAAIRGELRQELRAMNRAKSGADWSSRSSARNYAQELLDDLLEEAKRYGGMTAAELEALVARLGRGRGWRDRLSQTVHSPLGKSFAWGAGSALALAALWPVIRNGLRPVAKEVMKGALEITEQAQEVLARAREGVEDLVAEAQFEKAGEALEPEEENYTVEAKDTDGE